MAAIAQQVGAQPNLHVLAAGGVRNPEEAMQAAGCRLHIGRSLQALNDRVPVLQIHGAEGANLVVVRNHKRIDGPTAEGDDVAHRSFSGFTGSVRHA